MSDVETRWGPASAMFNPWLLEGFVPRASDVLLCTASKSGTTLLQQVLHQLRSGGDRSFSSINEVVPWLELPERSRSSREEQLASYEALPAPRVLKTHLPPERTPGADVVRIVCVARDPRDCCVSHFHHLHGLREELLAWLDYSPPADFDAYAAAWLTRADWFEVAPAWWNRRHASNVHWLRYADIVAEPRVEIERLVEFLGLGRDAIDVAVELSSLEWMRENEDRFTRLYRGHGPSFRPRSFVRKGVSGSGRAELTAEQDEAIVSRARALLDDEGTRYFGLA